MSETGRPTALGVARARFVEGLPRKASELRASTALLVGSPAEERPREELRRRLHALWASAQVFQIEALCDGLKDAIERLDLARDQKVALGQDDLDALAALAATLPLLGNKASPGAPAIPSSPPTPALLRSASTTGAPRLRPPKATGRPTLMGIGNVAMPSASVDLDTLCTVAVLAPEATVLAVRAAFEGDPRLDILVPDPGEPSAAFFARCGPDAILTSDAVDAARYREAAVRIGAIVRVLGSEVTGGLPAPTQREAFSRALKLTLRELPPIEPSHIAARLEDLEAALASDRARVSNRFDGLSIGALLGRIQGGRPDSSIHLRDAHDAIDAEMRGGQLLDVIRTARDGWYSRGSAALVPLLGMRRGLVAVERASAPVRKTLPDPESALENGRERLAALERATRPAMIQGIASIEIDTDAAPSAKKERAVDARVIDAIVRIGAIATLIEGGTSHEGLSSALLALARSGALTAIRGPNGEDRIAEAIEIVRSAPLPSEPEIRTLTQVPPPPELSYDESGDQDDDEDHDDEDDEDDDETERETARDERVGAAVPPRPVVEERAEVATADTLPSPEPKPVTRSTESGVVADVAALADEGSDDDDDDEPEPPLAVRAPARESEPRRPSREATNTRTREPSRPSKPRPGDEVPARTGPPDAFIYALVVAVLFLSGFVIWRFVRRNDPDPVPATTTTSRPTPPTTADPIAPTTSEPPATVPPPASDEAPTSDQPPETTPVAASPADGAFGGTRPNHAPPATGSGWLIAERDGWRVDGTAIAADAPRALPVGIHAVETSGESVHVRFVRVLADRTVVLPAL